MLLEKTAANGKKYYTVTVNGRLLRVSNVQSVAAHVATELLRGHGNEVYEVIAPDAEGYADGRVSLISEANLLEMEMQARLDEWTLQAGMPFVGGRTAEQNAKRDAAAAAIMAELAAKAV